MVACRHPSPSHTGIGQWPQVDDFTKHLGRLLKGRCGLIITYTDTLHVPTQGRRVER